MFDEEVNSIKKLAQEEVQLDKWIAKIEEFSNLNSVPLDCAHKYVTSQHLAPLLADDSVLVAIATPPKTLLKPPLTSDENSFTLQPPKDSQELRVFSMKSGAEMRQQRLTRS